MGGGVNATTLHGRKVVGGVAEGEALVTQEPISFFGGVDPATGLVTEKNHQLYDVCVTGKVLVYPTGKGSTGGSYRLYEMACRKSAPAAIVTIRAEPIAAIGAIMGEVPMVHAFDTDPTQAIRTGDFVRVDATAGTVTILRSHEVEPA